MTRPTINDGGIQREMTKAEHEEWLALVADIEAKNAATEALAAVKTSALNKLAALGLTEEEVGALLGR